MKIIVNNDIRLVVEDQKGNVLFQYIPSMKYSPSVCNEYILTKEQVEKMTINGIKERIKHGAVRFY